MHPDDINEERCADCCDDQLPVFSGVGRGIKGDGYRVVINADSVNNTTLRGESKDEATDEWTSEWISQNINGGQLSYQYKFRPYNIPNTFTITFIYRRPGREEWTWTTPNIPYVWHTSDGNETTDPDHHIGSGVATIFVRANKKEAWDISKHERLKYPDGTTRDDFNAPSFKNGKPEAWVSTVTFGIGGDVEIPNIEDLEKILGLQEGDIKNIINNNGFTFDGLHGDNILDWVKRADSRLSDHIHADLGFNGKDHTGNQAFGGYATVKAYIDAKIADLQSKLDNENNHINNLYGVIDDLINHIYGATGSTVTSGQPSMTMADGSYRKITWNPDLQIPQGNINVLSSDTSKAILTHSGESTGDVKAS